MKLLALLVCAASLYAQPETAVVAVKLANADGSAFTGTVTLTVQPLNNNHVAIRTKPIVVCSAGSGCGNYGIVNGLLTVSLVPNSTSTPDATVYRVVISPSRGVPYTRYWSVRSGGPWTNIEDVEVGTPDAVVPDLRGPQGIQGPVGPTGPQGPPPTFKGAWASGTTYSTNDAVSYNGSSYVALESNTGQQPDTNPSSWAVLAAKGNTGATGATGPQGPQGIAGPTGAQGPAGTSGPGYTATSTTPILIGTGTHTLATQSGLAYSAGARVRVASGSAPSAYMDGVVTLYSGTSLVFSADSIGGSGAYNDWNINLGPPQLSCPSCTVGATVCWGGSSLVPCSGGSAALSWTSLTSTQWASLTSSQWAALTN